MPHDLNPLILANKACLYQILFEAVADTLITFGHQSLTRIEVAYREQRLLFPASLAAVEAPTAFRGFVQSVLSATPRTADKTLFVRGASDPLPIRRLAH